MSEILFKARDSADSLNEYVHWLESILAAINDGILVIDATGIVRLINDEYTQITGVQKEAIIGRPLLSVRPGAQLHLLLKDGKARQGIYRQEGTVEYVVDMAPIFHQENIIGAVSVCKSLTEVHYLSKELNRHKQRVAQLEEAVGKMHQARYTFGDIIGANNGLQAEVYLAKKAANTDLSVLITGESGTGKELFAQAIHNASHRASFPFVAINCAAIPPSLLESELFGYEEGSFTNSKTGGKMGLFELAHRGTIFLDEIGDMSPELQAKLLRVLQEGRLRKVGSVVEQEIDVRVITATNKDLAQMVKKERFREDLFYRINGIHVAIPPLRERKGDIPALVDSFLQKEISRTLTVEEEAMHILLHYNWPGNIRELRNTVHYALNMTETTSIDREHLPDSLQTLRDKRLPPPGNLKEQLARIERELIIRALHAHKSSVEGKKQTAKELGISLATLYNKLSQHNIDF